MTTNEANMAEEANISECDGEKVVTMMDVLQEQEEFEEDANAVLGASDDKNCTYSKGYIKRQALYACLTCCTEAKFDETKRAGVCLACSLNCHENHELVELYTKRNFRCDCGNPKFNSHPCQFTPTKPDFNEENKYNQNFSGLYCICHRPYPDPESVTEDEMIQCIICEDWLHSLHLGATIPANDQYSEMICKACMQKNEFLHDYSELAVNVEDAEVNVSEVNGSYSNSCVQNVDDKQNVINTSISDMNEKKHSVTNKEIIIEKNVEITQKVNNTVTTNNSETGDNLESSDEKDKSALIDHCVKNIEKEHTESSIETEKENTVINLKSVMKEDNFKLSPSKSDNIAKDENIKIGFTVKTSEVVPSSEINSNEELEKINDHTNSENAKIPGIEKTDNDKSIENLENPTTDNINDATVSELNVSEVNNGNKEGEQIIQSKTENKLSINNRMLERVSHNKVGELTEKLVDKSSMENVTSIINKEESLVENVSSIIDKDPNSKEHVTSIIQKGESSLENKITILDKDGVSGEERKDDTPDVNMENDITTNSSTKKISGDNMLTKNKENEEPNKNDSDIEENINEKKRRLSIEIEEVAIKKQKMESKCTRPKRGKKVFKGATFWPSNFRQKLCNCSECLSMYKDLAVLYLIDLEDTVTAYETLGKEKIDGAPSQYEKGLQALSSLDRIQQINALTEYNRMRDKLLDFLKSFKDKKEIVKEEDIKAFFAGMKPKREPDGVYFCR